MGSIPTFGIGLRLRRAGPAEAGPLSRQDQETGTVVSAKAAWSGTSNRATPAAFVVTGPTTKFLPSPVAFHSVRVNVVFGGSPPMLYGDGGSVEATFRLLPCVSSPTIVSSPLGPAYAASSSSGWSFVVSPRFWR